MSEAALAAMFALATAFLSATFSIFIRKGQRYANATTGVLIGMIVTVPLLTVLTVLSWQPEWWLFPRPLQ